MKTCFRLERSAQAKFLSYVNGVVIQVVQMSNILHGHFVVDGDAVERLALFDDVEAWCLVVVLCVGGHLNRLF